jgi:hypothetical protein
MKKIIFTTISVLLVQAFMQKASSQANVQLSNLDNPTKINVNLLPDKDNLRSLGNSNKEWKDIYMRGIGLERRVYMDGRRFFFRQHISWP